jgi:hypothetical protein
MPQGCAKKIQIQQLLAYFSLQFVDPHPGLDRIGDVNRGRWGIARRSVAARWTANTAKRLSAAGLKSVAPVI